MSRIQELAAAAKYYGESEEPWKVLHEEANACHDLERQIVYGTYLCDALESAERTWRDAVASGLTPHNEDVATALDRAWEWWLSPCERAESAIRFFEAKGYLVEPARDFRERCGRARHRTVSGPVTGAWRVAVKNPQGRLFGKPALTEDDLRKKSDPFPD